ncbi:MAG: superoxide dismutase family protein [Planctomycetes bacterium]|nr:superoxide dismutase family protein [Planctomycetota bacterium]
MSGLTPGLHGFHIHEFGDCNCDDGKCAAAGRVGDTLRQQLDEEQDPGSERPSQAFGAALEPVGEPLRFAVVGRVVVGHPQHHLRLLRVDHQVDRLAGVADVLALEVGPLLTERHVVGVQARFDELLGEDPAHGRTWEHALFHHAASGSGETGEVDQELLLLGQRLRDRRVEVVLDDRVALGRRRLAVAAAAPGTGARHPLVLIRRHQRLHHPVELVAERAVQVVEREEHERRAGDHPARADARVQLDWHPRLEQDRLAVLVHPDHAPEVERAGEEQPRPPQIEQLA